MCWAFSFDMWGCGGVANVCSALHMWCAEHCTCGALHAGRARQNRGPRHTIPASCSCFGVKRTGLLVPPANSSRPPIVPQLMEPAARRYVSHCTCGALSIALVVRCTPDARDKTGHRDIPAPPPTAVLGSSAAASSSHQPIPRARPLFPGSWLPPPVSSQPPEEL